jgi:hypothetical protein
MSTALDRPAYNQTRSQPAQPFDMSAMLAAFVQAQQQQQQGNLAQQQNYFTNTNPLGITAQQNQRPMGLTPGSEWSAMFGGNAASAMTPEARMASQGGSAINQWAQPGRYAWNAPAQADPNLGIPQAQPTTFSMPTPLTSPEGNAQTDAMNLQQNMQMYQPGGMRRPMEQIPPPLPQKPKLRKGSSFGMQASGSPRPGFAF